MARKKVRNDEYVIVSCANMICILMLAWTCENKGFGFVVGFVGILTMIVLDLEMERRYHLLEKQKRRAFPVVPAIYVDESTVPM